MASRADRKLGCPVCGMMVTGNEKECPRCGKKFDKSSKYECPHCGASIPQSSKRCPSCQLDLPGVSQNGKIRSAPKTVSELMSDLVELESSRGEEERRYSCPNCAWHLDGTETKCPKCGQLLTGKLELRCPICKAPVDERLTECPRCGISLEKVIGVVKPMVHTDARANDKSPGKVSSQERPASRPCPLCGAIIPKSFQRCPLCNTGLDETKPQAEISAQKAESFGIAPPISSAPATVKIGLHAVRPTRTRKLKAEKVAAFSVSAPAGSIGLTNGVSQVNGLGKVNGTGATSGRAFVNGTGISNGLGAQSKESSARRRSFLTRWQFIAVLVAIVIVVPTFMFLSYSKESEEFSIDGDFADWDGATTYGTKIESTSSSSNITEWAIATQSFDLFLYFRTQAHMMSSSDPESYYLFVDSDGSKETGYVMESIGADYLLQLTGWDSAIDFTSLSDYSSSTDQYNWNAWISIGSLSYSKDFTRVEARTTLPEELGESARFLLVSKDSADRGSVSCTAPLKGGVLVVQQAPSAGVAEDGIITRSTSAPILTLTFKCEGEGGQVIRVDPSLVGAMQAYLDPPFSLEKGETREMTIAVDTSIALDGEFVSAEVLVSSITSSFASVEVIGSGAGAYVETPHVGVAVDGAFADWAGRLSVDQDLIPVTNSNVDIDEVGNVNTTRDSFFYISVVGDICSGTFVPAMISKPSGGGGGAVVPTRHTAEDILSIYVDSDRSNSTGEAISLDSKLIGADQKIEIRGLFGKITSAKELDYSYSGSWVESAEPIDAAKDDKRIEIGVSANSLVGGADIDFIVETTSWKGRSDLAMFDPSSMRALTRTWIVDSPTASSYATSMSYQRKMFYDGVNFWSLFFDGANTVYKHSSDDGLTWTYGGNVFTTPGVDEASIWFDSLASTVYAVGDTSSATNNVSIQVGTVDALAHSITWATSDFSLNTSSYALAGKNTYICKDSNSYLWVLSSNCTVELPAAYQLSVFKSSEVNSATSWVFSGQMLAATSATNNVKGSIVPAGSGSDVWAVYAYAGNVAARKYNNGAWSTSQMVYPHVQSMDNTDNSPPSVVVDGKGVVHVVYGTGRKIGPTSIPLIEYSHNNTDLTTFTDGVSLDPFIPAGIGDYYPTISLESSTGNLYVFWLQGNAASVINTLVGRKNVLGSWSNLTIEPQTSFPKQYLTSIYSAPDEYKICWQWTQNATSPIEVLIDHSQIPEFGDLVLPILGTLIAVAISRLSRRKSDERRQMPPPSV